jgi:heme-degrading monooxygenase HmoA
LNKTAGYVYVWEFRVEGERVRDFERAYSDDGEWALLFRRGAGYIRTELLRDRSTPSRFLTIDYWESEAAFDAFRSRFAKEFEALDTKFAAWTVSEKELGRFEPLT